MQIEPTASIFRQNIKRQAVTGRNTAVLKFMGPCIVNIFPYISNKMQRYTVYLYLETALHVSGGTYTHHQERKHLYLQHLVSVTPLLLPPDTLPR